MTTKFEMGEEDLDGLFAEARADAPLPPGSLVQRIEAAALAEQAARASRPPLRANIPSRGLMPHLSGWFRGLGLTAGLATATLAGVWLGAVQPAGLSSVTDSVSRALGVTASLDRVDLIPAFDPFQSEG